MSRQRAVLAEDGRLAHEIEPERHELPVDEQHPSVLIELILVGDVLKP
jgi:hypothetical protein